MVETIKGNILHTDHDIIVQQVNCLGVMGGGLAKQIMNRYPNVKKEYVRYWSKQMKKLQQKSDLLGSVFYVDTYDDKIIANVFGQETIRSSPSDKRVHTDTNALLKGLDEIKGFAIKHGYSIAIPTYIGCGLAGGDWNEIRPKIESLFGSEVDLKITFYHFGRT